MNTLTPLASFRAAAYAAFSRRQDALFELCDTLLTTGPVPSRRCRCSACSRSIGAAGAACMMLWPSARLAPAAWSS